VQTRAVRDGDSWVVNGQKVWNSGTLQADRGPLVVRTDSDLPKHRGVPRGPQVDRDIPFRQVKVGTQRA
jgi:alkylation response protein AidB-like acyl-CoA dehydrogenase